MATVIGDLAVRIGADTKDLTKGLNSAKRQAQRFTSDVKKNAAELLKLGAAGSAAAAGVAVLVSRSIEANREVANLAKLANTSVNTFGKMAFAAKSVGIEQQKFADILKDTSDRVGDFLTTGGGPMADFFERVAPKVGVTAEQFRKLSGPQALQLYVDSLEKANLSQNEMVFFMEAMASDASALLPLLRNGGDAMAAQAAQAERLGVALSDIQSAQIEQAAVQLDRMQGVISGFIDQFTAQLAPIVEALGRQFVGLAEDAGGVGTAASDSFGYVVRATGFVLDAVEGVQRAFELAGKTIAGFGLGAVEIMLRVANAVVNKPIQAINELIEKINDFTGADFEPISITKMGQRIQAELATVLEAQDLFVQDLHETLMRPLPSAQFEEFVKQAQVASEKSAAAMVKVRETMAGVGGPGGQNTKDEEADKQLRDKLQRIREGNMSELELLREKMAQENAIINEAKENRLIGDKEWRELMLQNLQQFESRQTELEEKASQERQRIAEMEQRAKLDGFSQMFGNISTLMNSESRKQFEIGKAAALAGAIVDGYAAITGAYAQGAKIGGPPLGAAFATAAGLATAQQINAIRSASFGGGGTPGAGSVTQGINAQGEAVRGGGAAANQTITLNPIDPNGLFTGRQIIDLINQARQDGAVIQGIDA